MLAFDRIRQTERLARLAAETGLAGASVVVHPLRAGARPSAYEPDRPLAPASMIKVPVAAALAAAWSRNEVRRDRQVAVDATNLTTTDLPSPLVAGYQATTEQLATWMLVRSDNVATNVLIDLLGRESISAYAVSIGLRGTAVRRKLSGSLPLLDDPAATGTNSHPAADAGRLFGLIARRRIPGAAWLERTLEAQAWNDKLTPGLRPGDRFAHKTGETSDVRHDGGILTTLDGRRFVVVVYSALSERDGDAPLQRFMAALRPTL